MPRGYLGLGRCLIELVPQPMPAWQHRSESLPYWPGRLPGGYACLQSKVVARESAAGVTHLECLDSVCYRAQMQGSCCHSCAQDTVRYASRDGGSGFRVVTVTLHSAHTPDETCPTNQG